MIIFLALVLIILMILIGGERGAVSLMTLAGNIVILFISILLMSIGFPALLLILAAGAGVCYNSLFYQNGNNPKTRIIAFLGTRDTGGFSGYLACDAAFIYSDLSYYMEIRKLWTE